jgi:chromosome segregation ATPase
LQGTKEFDLRFFFSGEEEAGEFEADMDNIIETRMDLERRSPLLYPRSRIPVKKATTKMGPAALKLEQVRAQRRDLSALKKDVHDIIEERDALILESKNRAAITENLKKERDALRREIEELRSQFEESDEVEKELSSLTQKQKDITTERDTLISEAQTIAAEKETLSKERDALELETKTIQAQLKAAELLEGQLQVAKVQCEKIARERDSQRIRFKRAEANCKAAKQVLETLRDEREEIRAKLKECNSLEMQLNPLKQKREVTRKLRNASILRAQKAEQCVQKMKIERDDLKLELENLRVKIKDVELLESGVNAARLLCDDLEKERDFYKLEAERKASNRDSLRKDIYTLQLKIEQLSAKCKNIALLEKELKTETQEYENMQKERNAVILRVRRAAADREALRKERDALKRRIENLRSQRHDAVLQQEQLNVTRKRTTTSQKRQPLQCTKSNTRKQIIIIMREREREVAK